MKKDKHIKGSIFLMLIRNYIIFTVAIILCGLIIFALASSHMRGIINEPLYQKLISYRSCLLNDEFYDIPVETLLGKGSMIQVLNEKNEIIYESRKNAAPTNYTIGELECIPYYNDYRYAQIHELDWTENDEKKQRLLTITYYNGHDKPEEESYLLNERNIILNKTVKNSRVSFTDKEIGYMTGEYPGNVMIQKYIYKNKFGISRTLLLILPNLSDHELKRAKTEITASLYIFIFLYTILIILFVFAMNRKFKVPIRLLNNALLSFAEGKRDDDLSYSGPAEFVKICNSFNIMAKRLKESETENKRLTEEKTKMLADISHDLKTPVTVIQGYTKAMYDGLVPLEKQKQYLEIIDKKSYLLGELINKFYEYSKLEHPDFVFHFETVDICEFSREYLADKFDELHLNGFDMEITIPDTVLQTSLDKMQFKRVFENLLSNTIVHNQGGTAIYFSIQVQKKDIIICYCDDGKGIRSEIAEHIFEPFVVEDPARNKNGSGLGLSIVKKIIDAHKGTIIIKSPPKKHKTEFVITLPLMISPKGE